MLEVKVLVGELFAVDGLAAGTVEGSEVTTLDHELLNDAVENGTCKQVELARRLKRKYEGVEECRL